MSNNKKNFAAPLSDLREGKSSAPKEWRLLAIWTVVLVVINICLSFITTAYQSDFKAMDTLVSYVIGSTLGIPVIVFLLSQILKKYRNGRSRVKAILYSSCFVLFAQGASFFNVVSEIGKQST